MYGVKAIIEKGLGVFAMTDIAHGTRMMCGRAVLYFELPKTPIMHVFFEALSKGRIKFLIVSWLFPGGGKSHIQEDSSWFQSQQTRSYSLHRLKISSKSWQSSKSNSCEMETGMAILHDLGRLNHLCLPNVYIAWNNGLYFLDVLYPHPV